MSFKQPPQQHQHSAEQAIPSQGPLSFELNDIFTAPNTFDSVPMEDDTFPTINFEQLLNLETPFFESGFQHQSETISRTPYEEFSPSNSESPSSGLEKLQFTDFAQMFPESTDKSAQIMKSSTDKKGALVLQVEDNFGKNGVCTATETAGKQFRLTILNPELKNATLHLSKYSIFAKTQWPNTEGVEWLVYTETPEMTDKDFVVSIEVEGIPLEGATAKEAKQIDKCNSQQCRASKSTNSDAYPLCFFSKKQAKGIKFNGVNPFIPIGFRCCPSYHECAYFKLLITLTNSKGIYYYCERDVHFLQSKGRDRKSKTSPSLSLSTELARPGKRARSEAPTPQPTISNVETIVHLPNISLISPVHGPPSGGTWLNLEGSDFSENCKILFSHCETPVETYRLNGSTTKLLCQTPAGRPGLTVGVCVIDGTVKSNEVAFTYDDNSQLQKSTMIKLQSFIDKAKSYSSQLSFGSNSSSQTSANNSSQQQFFASQNKDHSKQQNAGGDLGGKGQQSSEFLAFSILSMLQFIYSWLLKFSSSPGNDSQPASFNEDRPSETRLGEYSPGSSIPIFSSGDGGRISAEKEAQKVTELLTMLDEILSELPASPTFWQEASNSGQISSGSAQDFDATLSQFVKDRDNPPPLQNDAQIQSTTQPKQFQLDQQVQICIPLQQINHQMQVNSQLQFDQLLQCDHQTHSDSQFQLHDPIPEQLQLDPQPQNTDIFQNNQQSYAIFQNDQQGRAPIQADIIQDVGKSPWTTFIQELGNDDGLLIQSDQPLNADQLRKSQIYEELPNDLPPPTSTQVSGLSVEKLGTGQCGVVFKGTYNQQAVAIKKFTPGEGAQEGKVLSLLNHPNIVRFLGYLTQSSGYFMEYMKNGDLQHFLSANKSLDQSLFYQFCLNICAGMSYLHNNFVLHRDLAARNILVTMNLECKISDFGRAVIVEEDELMIDNSKRGPLKWMAPESLARQEYTPQSDMYSFGVLLFEIFSGGCEPYSNLSPTEAAAEVLKQNLRPNLPDNTPMLFKKIQPLCTQFDPNKRPTFLQLITWLRGALRSNALHAQKDVNTPNDLEFENIRLISKFRTEKFGSEYVGDFNGTPLIVKCLNDSVLKDQSRDLSLQFIPLNSPGLVQLKGVIVDPCDIFFLSESLPSSFSPLSQLSTPLDLEMKLKILMGICDALAFLHARGIAHQNLNPQNIFVSSSGSIKLANYGIIRKPNIVDWAERHEIVYRAPEFYRDCKTTPSSDVYSFTVILYELLIGAQPWASISSWGEIRNRLLQGERPDLKVVPSSFHVLISSAWADQPDLRPNIFQFRDTLQTLFTQITLNV